MKLNITQIQHHRNGISGAPFHAVTFRHHEYGRMIAVVFEQPHHVAVLQLDKLAAGDIEFGSNSWRGDQFESSLRSAIDRHEATVPDLPPDPEGMNSMRAFWAEIAIKAFQDASGTGDEDSLGDLLADLRHWADRHNFDFELALDRAYSHYEAETAQESLS